DLQQHSMFDAAVDDVCAAHAAVDRVQGTFDLGQHATIDCAIGDQVIDLGSAQAGQHRSLLVHHTSNVGEQHQLFCLEHLGYLARHRISVDVVGGTMAIGADGGYHGDEVAVLDGIQHFGIDTFDGTYLPHVQHLAVNGALFQQLAGLDQVAILACDADGLALILVEQTDDLLVHQAAKHHLHHVHSGAVRHPDAIDELRLDVQLLEQRTDLRPTTMHNHRVHTHQLHQHDVARETVLEHFIGHGVATVLHHDGAAGELLNIGKRFGQNIGDVLGGGKIQWHR